MIDVIKKYENRPIIRTFRSLPRDKYLALMNTASVMVGNSSSGIIEAPSFKLPVVNIGIRQEGRDRAENVIDVDHDKEQIKTAIRNALKDKNFLTRVKNCPNPYGDGKASERIVAVLRKTKITPDLLRKRITY